MKVRKRGQGTKGNTKAKERKAQQNRTGIRKRQNQKEDKKKLRKKLRF